MNKSIITYEDYTARKKKPFFYVKDIKKTLNYYKLDSVGKKDLLIKRLDDFYLKLDNYQNYTKSISIIQRLIKKYLQKKNKLKGPAFYDRTLCTNNEDFYTFVQIEDIEYDYFFSFADEKKCIWGFDIRSLNKLLKNKMNNPYNRQEIPKKAQDLVKKRLQDIKKFKSILFIEDILNPEQKYKNYLLEIFQKIDSLNVAAGGTDTKWFDGLTVIQLKNLYKHLEDIWNWRAELTEDQKKDIVPNNNVFTYSIQYVTALKDKDKRKLQYIILNEFDKLVSSSSNDVSKGLGAYYILIALVEVSYDCANAMPWLIMS